MKEQFGLEIDARRTSLVIKGRTYYWNGTLGCVLKSYEDNVEQGSIRSIGNVIFTAHKIYRRKFWQTPEIWWVPSQEFDMYWIRKFAFEVYGLALFVEKLNI